MAKLDDELKELIRLENIALEELHEVRASLKEVELALAKRDHGVEPGVIVRDFPSGESVYRVVRVLPSKSGRPWLVGHKKIKDGTFSDKRDLKLYSSWELVEGVENA